MENSSELRRRGVYSVNDILGYNTSGGVISVAGNTTSTNYPWEATRPQTQYGLSIPCTPEVKEYNPIKSKGGRKMKSTKLKVGDDVCIEGSTGTYKVLRANLNGFTMGTGVEGTSCYPIIQNKDGRWFYGNCQVIKTKDIKKDTRILVKGQEPKLVVKIGCKEFNVKGINKLAKKLLTIAKLSKDISQTPYVHNSGSSESYNVEDIENAIKWLKENKITS